MVQARHRRSCGLPDLWTRVIERVVHVVEKLCPPLERTLAWDFSDTRLMALEEEVAVSDAEGTLVPRPHHVRDLHEELGDFLPRAASAA